MLPENKPCCRVVELQTIKNIIKKKNCENLCRGITNTHQFNICFQKQCMTVFLCRLTKSGFWFKCFSCLDKYGKGINNDGEICQLQPISHMNLFSLIFFPFSSIFSFFNCSSLAYPLHHLSPTSIPLVDFSFFPKTSVNIKVQEKKCCTKRAKLVLPV